MKHYVQLIVATILFVVFALLMFFKLNIFMIIPLLISFEYGNKAYETIKRRQ